MSKVSTSFELNQLDSYIKGIDLAQKRLDDFAAKTNNSFANLKPPSVSAPVIDNDLKAAAQQIKLYEAQRLDIAKSSSLAVRALYKAETDAFKSEENAKLRAQKQSVKDFESALKSSSGSAGGFGSSFTSRVGINSDFGSAAFLGGLAGGAAVAGIGILKTELSSLTSTAEDLTVASIKLAGNFEETTNAVAVFAGGTANARRELAAIDKIALNTPGLKLQDAEAGYQRLRALNFEAKISQDLIKGLGTQRVLSGATSDAVDRVVTNLIQLKTGAGTAADVRQTIGQLPTLLPVFQKAFGTQDFGDINKIFKTDPLALQKFSDELAKAQTAQVGLNVSIEKGADAVTQAGRIFGEPFLDPITRDVQTFTKYLNENQDSIAKWGQFAADTFNGVSLSIQTLSPGGSGGLVGILEATGLRQTLNRATGGTSEAIGIGINAFAELGRGAREAEIQKAPVASFLDSKNLEFDKATQTFKLISDTVKNTPSLDEKLETKKAVENAKKVADSIAELSVKTSIDSVSQNLDVEKARVSLNAKGDGLKIARETAALEISALNQQIDLSGQLAAVKVKNLSDDDLKAGKDKLITAESAANVGKLNNQILVTKINLQKQLNDEATKGVDNLRETLVSYAAKENPFVKNFNEIETAAKRAQKQFGIFGDSVVNKIADIEKANLTKAINLQGFENNFSALTLRQQAQKLNATPENQFADFGRSTERISATVSSLATITKLQKDIDALTGGSLQSDIARSGIRREDRKFKEDFEDSQKGLQNQLRDNSLRGLQNFESIGSYSGPNDLKRLLKDSSDEGLNKFLRSRANFVDFQEDKSFKDRADKEKINDALTQVADLKKISTDGAGITGQGIVSKQIADILGAVKDVRTNPAAASAIREDLTKANQDLIRANKNELTDKLENLKFQDFGKIFARQQIDLINGSGITDDEKIKRRLSVTEALGNDLDPRLKEQRVRDLTREAQIKDDQQKEGLQISKDIKTLIEGVFAALTSDGIALDPASQKALKQAVDVTIKDQTAAGAKAEQQTAAANPEHVEDYYRNGGSFNLIRR